MRAQLAIVVLLCLAQLASSQTPAACTGSAANAGSGCKYCASHNTIACLFCKAGYGDIQQYSCIICAIGTYSADGSTGICTSCPNGQTTSGTGKTTISDCFNKITDCTAQTSATVCTTCIGGKSPVNSGALCATPITDCTTYSTAGLCTTCISGKAPVTGGASCVTAIPDCTAQTSATVCTVCGSGKILVNSGASCVTAIENCAVQTTATECTTCKEGFNVSSDKKSCALPSKSSSNSILRIAVIGFIMAFFILFF